MKRRRSSRLRFRGTRGVLPPEVAPDWVNPPEGIGSPAPRADRKLLQLCSQIADTLEQVLAEQEEDDLRDLHIESVDPAPNSTHLLVTVRPITTHTNPSVLMGRLNEVSGRLRSEVAAAITRRRAPTLTFRVVPTAGREV
jgi:ribosome-binding factor A